MSTKSITAASLLAVLAYASPSVATSQCPPSSTEESAPGAWRQRLAAWVPSITFEVSDRLTRHDDGRSRMESQSAANLYVESPTSIQLERRGRRIDWSIGAYWNVVEIVESLSPSPLQESGEDEARCTERVGAPRHLQLEEAP